MKKILAVCFFYVLLVVLLLPLAVTFLFGGFSRSMPREAEVPCDILLSSELEEYVSGVVAAEMPASFPEEALKAQAVAARTYQVRQMQASGTKKVLYDVGQAYITEKEQREKWGENTSFYRAKIRKAVAETEGEIMVYDGEPILAAFHAQSAGRTEAAEHVWQAAVPYLKSVESDNGETVEVIFSEKELQEKFGSAEISVVSRTDAGYVAEVQVGEKIMTGREVREALGLRSSSFSVRKEGDDFIFTVSGYGHGVGMSQHGAAELAERGMDYREILRHYYQDIRFEILE